MESGCKKCFLPLSLMAMLICLLFPYDSPAQIINYENDPDLEMAMQFDSEYNDGDLKKSSQSLAEKHYLKYLEKCKESSQRAKVYCQLGVLFATNWHAQNGEKPDFEKSVMYMKKVLEEEPVRIGQETKRARAFLNTPLASREESMELRIEHYDWLLKTKKSIEKADPSSEIWLPIIPGKPLSEEDIKNFKRHFADSMSAQASNLVGCAHSFPDPIDKMRNLQRIIDRFPATEAAKEAVSRLSAVGEKMQESLEAELDMNTLLKEPPKNMCQSTLPASSTNTIKFNDSSAKASVISEPRGLTGLARFFITCGILIFSLAAFFLVKYKPGRTGK